MISGLVPATVASLGGTGKMLRILWAEVPRSVFFSIMYGTGSHGNMKISLDFVFPG